MADNDASALEAAELKTSPTKGKLSRKLLPLGFAAFLMIVILVAFVQNGSDLGQGEEDRKRAEALAVMKAKGYEDAVPDPAATAAAAAEAAAAEARKQAAANPVPGAPLPIGLPTNSTAITRAELERYEAARQAIATATLPKGASSGQGAEGTGQNADIGATPRASFVSTSIPNAASQHQNQAPGNPQSQQLSQAKSEQPRKDARSTARDSARDMVEMQMKARDQAANGAAGMGGKPNASALPNDANSAWLYAAQSREPTENKPLQAQVTNGRHVIFAGTSIQAVLSQAVNTKLPGVLTARVTRDVYDSRYQQFLVIPRGSTLTGAYRSAVSDGQERVLMAFDRLITPAGGSVPLGNMSASDALGVGGVPGELHTHFFQRMGIATLLALETAFVEKKVGAVGTVPGNTNPGQATSSASGQILLQTANQELSRQYAVTPHITIEPAAVITVISSADIEIPPIANLR